MATDELLKNQAIRLYSGIHNFSLSLNTPQTVRITVPVSELTHKLSDTYIMYEPEVLDIQEAHSNYSDGKIHLTLTLIARDLGSTNFSLVVPPYKNHAQARGLSEKYLRLLAPTT